MGAVLASRAMRCWLPLFGAAFAVFAPTQSAAQSAAAAPTASAPGAPPPRGGTKPEGSAAVPAKPPTDNTAPAVAPTAAAPSGETPGASPPSKPEAPEGPKEGKPPPSGPPEYYVEEQKRGAEAPGASPTAIYEPPPPPVLAVEPPPPIQPNYVAPKTAFWAGLRVAYFVPFGPLWFDGSDVQGGLVYRRRPFSAYASPGPAAEVDIGVRLGRRYNVFAMWEHASLGTGNLDPNAFGGQERGNTNLYGAGFRFSTQPNTVGFLVEIGLGYRDFRAYWADGTSLVMNDTFFDAHIGLGADIRVNKWLSLSPMAVFGAGAFQSAEFSGPSGSYPALGALDREGDYGTFSLQIGAHADVF